MLYGSIHKKSMIRQIVYMGSLTKRVYCWIDNKSTKRKLNKDWQILYCRMTYFSAGVLETPLKNPSLI